MAVNPGFQVSVDVKGRLCVVIGGDEEAAEKVHRLLEAGAKVTVVSPTLNDALRKLAASAKVIHRVRTFRATDAAGVMLVINTIRTDRDYARSLYELALKERFLLCSVDLPEYSTCMMPAVVACGHLRVAVSTSGVAPAMARRLRQDLEEILGEEMAKFTEWLQTLREGVQSSETEGSARRDRLRAAVEGVRLKGSLELPSAWRETTVQSSPAPLSKES